MALVNPNARNAPEAIAPVNDRFIAQHRLDLLNSQELARFLLHPHSQPRTTHCYNIAKRRDCTYRLDVITIKEPTEMKTRQYQSTIELSDLARQRYLDAGGDPRRAADERYMTDEEKREYFELGRQVFGFEIRDGEVYCQERSWKIGS